MQRKPLDSHAIPSAGYDPDARVLEIEFEGGRIYRYDDVPEGVYQWLLRTPNKGSFVSRMVSDAYSYREVTPAAAEQDLLADLLASLAAEEHGED